MHANDEVSVAVAPGTIHGIVGENGAGKSTLMSIVYGYYQADGGEIRVGGTPVAIKGPEDAIGHGIGMVHQHFMLVDTFTVLENVVLGVEQGYLLRSTLREARQELERIEREYGLDVDPDAIVGSLPVGLQQRVEILKALYRGADILILDEPTGVLTPQEVDDLFRILRALRDQGRTIILITHKLREIMALTDRVTVMRAGRVVDHVATAETDRAQLAAMMVGRSVLLRVNKEEAAPGEALLQVENLAVRDRGGVLRVHDVSFTVHAGEIVGIAGVAGNGQSELLEALAGTLARERGTIAIGGAPAPAGGRAEAARAMRRRGLGHVPEDRQRMGLVTAFDASESGILGYHREQTLQPRRADEPRRRGSTPSGARWGTSTCARRSPSCARPISPAATNRRSWSAARWAAARTCCWSASRPAASISAPSSSSTASSWRCGMRARRSCSSRSSSTRSCRSPTASW